MTDEQIRMLLVLKHGTVNNVIDLWLNNKIELTENERRVLADAVLQALDGVINVVKFVEDPRRVECETIRGKEIVHGGNDFS